jgi:hypothetical protein
MDSLTHETAHSMNDIATGTAILDSCVLLSQELDFTRLKRSAEKEFYRGIATWLKQAGYNSDTDIRYLGTRKECDLYAYDGQSSLFVEVKILFTEYWRKRTWPRQRLESRLFHPLKQLGDETHSVAQDLQKLACLRLPKSTHLGILVVSSETDLHSASGLFAEFAALARIDALPWNSASRRIANPYWQQHGFHLDFRLWVCPRERVAGWWEATRPAFNC